MNKQKILFALLFALALTLALSWLMGVSLAKTTDRPQPPPHHRHGASGICGDQQFLYVVLGGRIIQYGLTDLRLVQTVDLPKPALPSTAPKDESEDFSELPPPPPMGGPGGCWTGEGALFVLAGPMLHRYITPGLTLDATVELPKPAPPQTSN